MGRNDERVFPFGKPKCKLLTKFVGIFRGDLSGFERLPDLVSNNIAVSCPSGFLSIQTFLQHEFFIDCHGITAVGSD